MAYRVESLYKNLEKLDIFLDDIIKIWKSENGPEGIEHSLNIKRKEIKKGKIKGIVLFKDDIAIGCGWTEKVGLKYGNFVLHCLDESYVRILVETFIKEGQLNDILAELITFSFKETYAEILKENKLADSRRKRMALYFNEWIPKDMPLDGLTVTPLTTNLASISSTISFEAHKVSKDQKHAPDLASIENRIEVESHVLNGKYGKLIRNATLLLQHNGIAIGSCIIVEIECWGFKKVPWVFDISIHPNYHGKGYGRVLLQTAISALIDSGQYKIMGLAVTLSNFSAANLYHSLGFFDVDEFVEYAFPLKDHHS